MPIIAITLMLFAFASLFVRFAATRENREENA